jgi:hypothetical protein
LVIGHWGLLEVSLLIRRFLVLAALFFWQGGFTFYTAVVVPVGAQELHSNLRQGFITRRVTNYINLSGGVALLLLAWDLGSVRAASGRARRTGLLLWAVLLLTLACLVWLHTRLDELLVPRGRIVLDPETFRPRHRLYLWVSTLQWIVSVVYLLWTLRTWRAQDRSTETPVRPRAGTGSAVLVTESVPEQQLGEIREGGG